MEFTVEDAGVCRKKLTIRVAPEDIEKKLDERFTELEGEAVVPGFRPGHAPRRLVERRFHDAVHDEVKGRLIAEAYQEALKEKELDVIGEPDFDPENVEMPEGGAMEFSVELEVRPEFELPDYTGIPVDVERPEITDKDVEEAVDRFRESNGRLEDAPDDATVEERDLVMADLAIQAGDEIVVDRQNVRLPVAPIAIEGIRLEVLPELLKGAAAGETRTRTITIGDDAEREELRDTEAELRVKVDAISRIALPDDETLRERTGYESMDELREGVRRQLRNQSERTYQQRQEQAIEDWLLEHTPFGLPDALVQRHATRLLQRQVMGLQYRGVPVDEIEKNLDDIRGATSERAARSLKLYFILDRIAGAEEVEATDAEVDARVRFMAVQHGRREDKVREEMERAGDLDELRSQIREDKVRRLLLEKAAVAGEEAPEAAPAAAAEAEDSAPSAATPAEETDAEGAADADAAEST